MIVGDVRVVTDRENWNLTLIPPDFVLSLVSLIAPRKRPGRRRLGFPDKRHRFWAVWDSTFADVVTPDDLRVAVDVPFDKGWGLRPSDIQFGESADTEELRQRRAGKEFVHR